MLACIALGWGCEPPRPQSLTVPSEAEANRAMRESMTSFNEARFKAECAAINSAVVNAEWTVDTLPGGVLLQRAKDATSASQNGLKGWQASPGDRVQWDWVAYTLDGALLTSGSDEFEVERAAVPRAFHEAAKALGHGESRRVVAIGLSLWRARCPRERFLRSHPFDSTCVKRAQSKTQRGGAGCARRVERSLLAQECRRIHGRAGAACQSDGRGVGASAF